MLEVVSHLDKTGSSARPGQVAVQVNHLERYNGYSKVNSGNVCDICHLLSLVGVATTTFLQQQKESWSYNDTCKD